MIEHGIDEQELERAKCTILHDRQLSLAQDGNILGEVLRQLFYGTDMTSAWSERNQAFADVTLSRSTAPSLGT